MNGLVAHLMWSQRLSFAQANALADKIVRRKAEAARQKKEARVLPAPKPADAGQGELPLEGISAQESEPDIPF